tara:strand:+ start:1892 stop:2113 length:222 start_codon:yes stop_codon:yes gene_type:complete
MVWNIEAIIFYLFLLDSLGANIAAWFFSKWYKKTFKKSWFFKRLPLTKGWAFVYLALVLWVGYGLYRLGILVW